MNTTMTHTPQTMQPNNGTAMRSANFVPHTNTPNSPAMGNMRPMNTTMTRTPQTVQPNNSTAMRSANFVPHANAPATPNMAHPGGASYSNLYRPGGTTGVAPASHAMQPMNVYRAPSTAYRPAPAPAYHPAPAPVYRPQPQYHAPAPTPQYHAYHPAPAPAPHPAGGGAPRGGGGRDTQHHG